MPAGYDDVDETFAYEVVIRVRLYSRDWDDIGEFTTAVPNWSHGDEFTTGDGHGFRIVGIVPVDDDAGVIRSVLDGRAAYRMTAARRVRLRIAPSRSSS